MKFSCEKYILQQAISTAARCAASKSPIPALEGLLVEAGQEVRVTGYDLKKGIYTKFSADVAEAGSIVLNARLFGEIVRNLPDGIVTVAVENGFQTTITCEASAFSIMGTDSGEYPELPSVERQSGISIPQNVLSKMIHQTIFAVSDNESRPVYTGSLFEVKDNNLIVVAVDGYRLAMRKESVEAADVEECSFIVPGSALNDVEKLCAEKDEKVSITVGAKHISFVIDDTVLITRRLEGEFLNYSKSVPNEFGIIVEADREDLMRSVSRVSLIIDEKTKNPIRLSVTSGRLLLHCVTGIGSGGDECVIKNIAGDSIVIGFNNRYLLDALKAAPTDNVRIGFNSPSAPCVVLPADGSDNFAYMILPVRIRS